MEILAELVYNDPEEEVGALTRPMVLGRAPLGGDSPRRLAEGGEEGSDPPLMHHRTLRDALVA